MNLELTEEVQHQDTRRALSETRGGHQEGPARLPATAAFARSHGLKDRGHARLGVAAALARAGTETTRLGQSVPAPR